MNGYTTNGFVQSMNGILTISDGNGTTIENGTITTNSFTGNGTINFTDTTDTSSLLDTSYAVKVSGGAIFEKNVYATDVMTNNVATGNIACGNINSSNRLTTPKVICNSLECNTITANNVYYKNKLSGYINLGIAPYIKVPLTTSMSVDEDYIVNFNVFAYLTNANNNTIILFPYYKAVFYNLNTILLIVDNSSGSVMYYNTIQFERSTLSCTKILLYYKNNLLPS